VLFSELTCTLRLQLFIDTTGWAFTYPVAAVAGAHVVAYTHYPTVSTNMISRLWQRHVDFSNSAAIAGTQNAALV